MKPKYHLIISLVCVFRIAWHSGKSGLHHEMWTKYNTYTPSYQYSIGTQFKNQEIKQENNQNHWSLVQITKLAAPETETEQINM